jgi:prepilin-type N-terminal cleavage/methylation domain-containing protein
MTRSMKKRGGFTLIESLMSTAIMSVLVLAAFVASESAMRATSRVASVEAADERVANSLTRLRRLLMPASLSALEAIPPIALAAPEPMQDSFVYDNVQFRIVTGFANGARVYVPPFGTNAWRIWYQPGNGGNGSLMLDDGKSITSLLEHVRGATFVLRGRHLTITLLTAKPDAQGTATCELRLALLVL